MTLDSCKTFLADMARPFVLYTAGGSASIATVRLSWLAKNDVIDLNAGAIYIGAAWAGVAALYGAKALEKHGETKAAASVKIAQANNASPDTTGELDPAQRVRA